MCIRDSHCTLWSNTPFTANLSIEFVDSPSSDIKDALYWELVGSSFIVRPPIMYTWSPTVQAAVKTLPRCNFWGSVCQQSVFRSCTSTVLSTSPSMNSSLSYFPQRIMTQSRAFIKAIPGSQLLSIGAKALWEAQMLCVCISTLRIAAFAESLSLRNSWSFDIWHERVPLILPRFPSL